MVATAPVSVEINTARFDFGFGFCLLPRPPGRIRNLAYNGEREQEPNNMQLWHCCHVMLYRFPATVTFAAFQSH